MLIPHIINDKLLSVAMIGFVSPHGMTDLIHSKKYGFQKELFQINAVSASSALIAEHFHYGNVVTGVFLFASVIHFRNDMPFIKNPIINPKLIQLFFSFLMVQSLFTIPIQMFALYMLFIHTPNHYKMSWIYIKEHLLESMLLIGGLGLILLQLNIPNEIINPESITNANTNNNNNFLLPFPGADINIVESIVISHIIYQEYYVFPEMKQMITNVFSRFK